MEAAALEETLRDQPDDLNSWYVYGELMRTRGDARGELIQLEQRHAHARPADREVLKREIDLLVEEHQQGWDAELPPEVTVLARRYGFATKVCVEWSDEEPALIEEALRGRFVTALRIAPPAHLEDEDGDYEDYFDEDGERIPLPPIEAEALAERDFGPLTELDLSYFRIGEPGAKALAAASAQGRIQALDLRYCFIGDVGLAAVAESPIFGDVRRLHLQYNALTAEGMRTLARFERLADLDLRYNAIGEEGVDALLAAPFTSSLKRLLMYPDDVSDAGVQKLAQAPQLPTALRSLWRTV